jgi:hypothetical protein
LESWGIAIESRIDWFVNFQFAIFNFQFAIPSILDPRSSILFYRKVLRSWNGPADHSWEQFHHKLLLCVFALLLESFSLYSYAAHPRDGRRLVDGRQFAQAASGPSGAAGCDFLDDAERRDAGRCQ